MAHASGDSHEYPIYGAHYRIVFPIFDADGDLVTGATGLDSERSIDHGTFTDCTNEATEIATSSGMYYLDLTGAETTGSAIAIIVKTTSSGAKTTPMTLYPKRTSVLESGTAQAGAASTITLASGASTKDSYYNGLYVLITNDSPAGARYQARRVISYVGSTRVATVESAWGTNPSSASTYDIVVPDTSSVAAWAGVKLAEPNTAGHPLVDAGLWRGTQPNVLVSGRVDASAGALATGVIAAGSFTAGAVDAAAIATDAIGANEFAQAAADKVWSSATRTLTAFSTALALSVWDVLLANISTATSIGKKLKDWTLGSDNKAILSSDAHTGAVIPTVTTLTGHTPQTGDTYARIGATGSGLTSLASQSDVTAIKAKTDNLPSAIKKNTALNNFVFVMTDATTHVEVTGKVNGDFTKQYSLDGGSFSALSGTITEVGNGAYKINLTAGELNGNSVILRFAASGCDTVLIPIVTNA